MIDDGRRPNLLSKIGLTLAALIRPPLTHSLRPADEATAQCALSAPVTTAWKELRTTFSPDSEISRSAIESFLLSLAAIPGPLAFEVVGTGNCVWVEFCAPAPAADQVEQQLSFHLPQAIVQSTTTNLVDAWQPHTAASRLIMDFGLSREFFYRFQFRSEPLSIH